MKTAAIALSLAALQGATAFTAGGAAPLRLAGRRAAPVSMEATVREWDMKAIKSADGSPVQRIEGLTRKTWKFNDIGKDRVQVALESEGRPVHADIQLWIGPDWTPFSLKVRRRARRAPPPYDSNPTPPTAPNPSSPSDDDANHDDSLSHSSRPPPSPSRLAPRAALAQTYSEDGKARPIKTLVGTRNKQAMIEVQNKGEQDFPINAISGYASDAMAKVPTEITAVTDGVRIDGNALRSWPISEGAKQVEVVLHTDGRQLNAKIELLNAPNNPKQVYEVFTNNGDLNRLVVCFDVPDAGNTLRVVNLATVEFPCYANINQVE